MAYTFTPSNPSANSIDVVYGIDDILTQGGTTYILQDVNVSEDVNTVQIPDQKGAIAQIKTFQHHWTISCTAIGPNTAPATVGSTQTVGGIRYFVQSCERRATYNDTQKWSLTMEAWEDAVVDGASGAPLGPTAST